MKMTKTITSIIVASCLVFVQALPVLAETVENNPVGGTVNDIASGNVMEENNGQVTDNHGEIVTNNGNIGSASGSITGNGNFGTVDTNNVTITSNKDVGVVRTNAEGATVKDNGGTVTENHGSVDYNYGTVGDNYGTVGSDPSNTKINIGTVQNNYGIVGQNGSNEKKAAVVEVNASTGTVTINYATVTDNYGTVAQNGFVHNSGTVTNNYGTVSFSYGTVTNNFGTVTNSSADASVENNYGGTITASYTGCQSDAKNQFYSVTISGLGDNSSASYDSGFVEKTVDENGTKKQFIQTTSNKEAIAVSGIITITASDDYEITGNDTTSDTTNLVYTLERQDP